jgi:hypothetical protein
MNESNGKTPREIAALRRKNIGIKGMFIFWKRVPWTITGKVIYFFPLHKILLYYAERRLIGLLRKLGFYAVKCGCDTGGIKKRLRFRLFKCKACTNK